MNSIGITTTVPIEVLLSAGYQPIDLNNVFISDSNPDNLVSIAEKDGFPLNCCTWIKGIYGVCKNNSIDTVFCVTTGDCSNTTMLMEVWKLKGLKVFQFAFPSIPDTDQMQIALEKLAAELKTSLLDAEKIRLKLKPVRASINKLDELTWKDGKVSGYENHYWQVTSSDFNQNPLKYHGDVKALYSLCLQRKPHSSDVLRIAYLGVPPIFARDLHSYLEKNGAITVFNEIQRQFTMPQNAASLAEQYTHYTYPYSIFNRLKDIKREIKKRNVDGIIHYVQAFCHRGIGDIILRESLDIPMLTLEGNQDFYLTQHIKTRIEAFLDMVRRQRKEEE
jgi:benzoyl-CoA reductase/2-hydroxyglutaryl-CoA dehydratase subunit BcrC/BadD/HgdB